MSFFAGVDIGSVSSKAVIINENRIASFEVIASGGSYREAGSKALDSALSKISLSRADLSMIVATGYGASNISSDKQVNEFSCQGRALNHLFPEVRTIIDIGGQASRVIRVDSRGRVADFAISEKCAAGSGRFLQVMARVLQMKVEDLGPLSLKSSNAVRFGTGCAVFAESEAITRITQGNAKEDIIAGVHNSIAAKVLNLIQRVRLERECAITGGGALDIGLVRSVEAVIGVSLLIPPQPQITAALGAALIARET